MKQLELDFNSDDLSDHYKAYQVIDEGKNQICCWLDSLSDDGKKISYDEYTYNTPHCMDFENWIHIDKKCLKKTAYKWFCMFLIFFSTLDSIFIDFKDAKRHKTCIIHGFILFE